MPVLLRDRLFLVWVLLVAVTLLSSQIGGSSGVAWIGSPAAVTVAVLSIALAKVWMVMFTYMDVRGAPLALRVLVTAWVAIVLTALLAIYFGALS
ncbi:MAG: cytochrome C oxidase subunit IV family protein [Novosphingobium sp.]|nr:cytochrome C oxidase subunit IV family protein [Novosphingobium sp.]